MRWSGAPVVAIFSLCCVQTISAAGVVTNCTEAELDAALAAGGNVVIACDGTIPFTNTKVIATNTTLDATGYSCTLSGNNRTRLFSVNTGVVFTVRNLTLAFGAVTNLGAFPDGGAAVLNSGTVKLERCLLVSNRVYGVSGTQASGAQGGAIHNNAGTIIANDCTFLTNTCTGGTGGNATLGHSTGYSAGSARGGAIFSDLGFCWVTNSSFVRNAVVGGNGGRGVDNFPSGFGGSGGDGGSALGGALYLKGSTVALVNCTLATNRCRAGAGGMAGSGLESGDPGSGGDGQGGGFVNVGGTVACVNATLAANRATAGSPFGLSGGDNLDTSGATAVTAFTNTIVAYGVRTNVTGVTITDGGNNISSDGSCRFTRSFNNIDPRLLPLRDNGGATPTMLPRPDSLAINNANLGVATLLDQRGFARDLAPDIGAVEFQPPRISNSFHGSGHFRFDVTAENGVAYLIQFAPGLPHTNWFILPGPAVIPTNRMFSVDDTSATTASNRFYRVSPQ